MKAYRQNYPQKKTKKKKRVLGVNCWEFRKIFQTKYHRAKYSHRLMYDIERPEQILLTEKVSLEKKNTPLSKTEIRSESEI